MLTFIDAEAKHADFLRDTLIASKGHWGYSYEQLEKWRANLRFEEGYIAHNTVKLVLKDGEMIGFFAIVNGDTNDLDHLWLLPNAIGKGYGSKVFERILKECKALKISEFYIVSDPDAVGFYLKKGALKVGEVYSEAQRRLLPKLKFVLVENT